MSFDDEIINDKYSKEKKGETGKVPNDLPKIDTTKIKDSINVIRRVGNEVENPRPERELK